MDVESRVDVKIPNPLSPIEPVKDVLNSIFGKKTDGALQEKEVKKAFRGNETELNTFALQVQALIDAKKIQVEAGTKVIAKDEAGNKTINYEALDKAIKGIIEPRNSDLDARNDINLTALEKSKAVEWEKVKGTVQQEVQQLQKEEKQTPPKQQAPVKKADFSSSITVADASEVAPPAPTPQVEPSNTRSRA